MGIKLFFPVILLLILLIQPTHAGNYHSIHFTAELTNENTVPFVEKEGVSGTAKASLVFTRKGPALNYVIETNMDANAGWPTTDQIEDDISKIHLHNNVEGSPGPHVLNIYKGPAQDDDNLKVFPSQGKFKGRWDSRDLNDDRLPVGVATQPFSQCFIEELCNGRIYVNIHGTNSDGTSDTGVLRGNFHPTKSGKKFCENYQ